MDDSMGLCAVDHTFWKGLRGLRGRPDSQNDRFPILKTLINFIAIQSHVINQDSTVLKSTGTGGPRSREASGAGPPCSQSRLRT